MTTTRARLNYAILVLDLIVTAGCAALAALSLTDGNHTQAAVAIIALLSTAELARYHHRDIKSETR